MDNPKMIKLAELVIWGVLESVGLFNTPRHD